MVFAEARQAEGHAADPAERRRGSRSTPSYKGGKLEGWSYPGNAIADNSNTQYALLGLYAAKTAGVKIDDKLWNDDPGVLHPHPAPGPEERAGRVLDVLQRRGDPGASFTMTVGGVCGLLIAGMGLDQSEQQLERRHRRGRRAAACTPRTPPLAKGMFWVGVNFNFQAGQVVLLQLLRHRAARPPLRAAVHRQDRLVPRGVRAARPDAGGRRLVRLPRRPAEGQRRGRRQPGHRHLVRAAVPLEGPHPGPGQQVRVGQPPAGRGRRPHRPPGGGRGGQPDDPPRLEPQAQRLPQRRRVRRPRAVRRHPARVAGVRPAAPGPQRPARRSTPRSACCCSPRWCT